MVKYDPVLDFYLPANVVRGQDCCIRKKSKISFFVILTKVRIQSFNRFWTPVFTGVTELGL
ncbi:MAG: hypothetical protein C4522_00805 [Desulfobacteraceae bacterium]|nr:MAG: hypothetical protein C4522_00805 [Desulfobacteraceae bacterium]